mmetsp:Transcript_10454/g.18254  ORF Transcript_10454/g.18254 Transcript_10454/m.18254 type:complete len:230 (+) Transcript_10454:47-736(+)
MRAKHDFKLAGLQPGLAHVKAGDVLIIQAALPDADTPGAQACQTGPLSCHTADGVLAGMVPPNVTRILLPYCMREDAEEVQARVRSVKRGPDCDLQELLLRVEITEAGPVPQVATSSIEPIQPAATPGYELDDEGYQLRRNQVEQLVLDHELRLALKDERLQKLLVNIDSSRGREKALEAALQEPAFMAFAEQVLSLLDTGLPQATAPSTAAPPNTAATEPAGLYTSKV